MKTIAAVMLIAIVAGISSPLCIRSLPFGKDDGIQRLVTLDVCGGGHGGVSLSTHAPFLVCSYCRMTAPPPVALPRVTVRIVNPPIVVIPEYRPPKA
ncbi:MAG: hypothetical protein HZA22_00125 [Nitrospirae bacterium]|nr:hypothetical protein [Nitrospirota bacterium]MBI5695481.1 hypothetical protein [Nitrospirota bacterium]